MRQVFKLIEDGLEYVVWTDEEGNPFDITIQSIKNPQTHYIFKVLDWEAPKEFHALAVRTVEDGVEIDPMEA